MRLVYPSQLVLDLDQLVAELVDLALNCPAEVGELLVDGLLLLASEEQGLDEFLDRWVQGNESGSNQTKQKV